MHITNQRQDKTMFTDIILIAIICVLLIDITPIMHSIKSYIAKQLSKKTKMKISASDINIKPIDCSICMTFWLSLFWVIFIYYLTLPALAFILFIACLTPLIKSLFYVVYDAIDYVQNYVSSILNTQK